MTFGIIRVGVLLLRKTVIGRVNVGVSGWPLNRTLTVISSPGLSAAGFVTGTISSVSPITVEKPLSVGVTFTNALENFSIL
jgi:hypothetical protein